MLCRYCGAQNSQEEHRCNRCGRRLSAETTRSAPDAYPTRQSPLASTWREPLEPSAAPTGTEGASPRTGATKPPFQPALFSARDLPQVLPMDSFAPQARQSRPRGSSAADRPASRAVAGRRQLDLYSVEAAPEVVRYTNAPVAARSHRILAASFDMAMVLIAVALLLIPLQLLPGEMRLTRQMLVVYGMISFAVLVFYKLFWAFAGADPPGMRWTNLKLLNFDGRPPTRRERLIRVAGGCLGVLAVGLGILWPLVDAETLSWHDHMSKTFATPYAGDRTSRR